jgi:hypothetical protein
VKDATPLRAADLFQIGCWFRRNGQVFEITAWSAKEPLRIEARAAGTDVVHVFVLTELFDPKSPTHFAATQAELMDEPHSEALESSRVADAATLPPHLVNRADHIVQAVEAIRVRIEELRRQHCVASEQFSLTDATRQACEAMPVPISLSSYYVYRRLYQTCGGDRGQIAAALHRKTHGKMRLDPNAQHFIDTLVSRFYRSNPPLRPQTVYAMGQQLWRHNRGWWLRTGQTDEANSDKLVARLLDGRQGIDDLLADPIQVQRLVQIKLPSRTWFYDYIKWYCAQPGEGANTYITRHGQADWEANFLFFDRFVQTATLPLQYVVADHYKLDVLHVDDEFRELLGRLWLTLLIDAYSRAPLGLYLAYEDPNIESIQGALRHAIWPKCGLAEFGIDLPWLCYGIPQRLFLDNAWAHHSHSLEDLVRALAGGGRYTQMELVFRPPYKARYGGLVERLFGNLSGQVRELLPGAVLQPNERHWHNASQGACLLYSDVVRLAHQMVVDYLHTPHEELDGLTPHEKWLAGLQLMTPVPPSFTPQLERCFWRLYPDPRVATQGGLSLFGLHYWDVGLRGLRSHDRQGRRRRFHLRYDPVDIGRVAVFEGGVWLGDGYARELRLPDGSYERVSLWELNLAKDLVRQRNQGRLLRPHSWLIHLLEARELVVQRQAEQRLIRRKVQQLREQRPTNSHRRRASEVASIQEAAQAMAEPMVQDHDPRSHLLEKLSEVL